MTTVPTLAALRDRPLAVWSERATWRAALHLATTVALGPVWAVVLAGGLMLLVVPPIGFPFAIATIALARQGAIMERGRARVLLGVTLAEPYRPLPRHPLPARLRAAAADPATWRDLLAVALLLPAAAVAAVGLALPLLGLALLGLPLWYRPEGLALAATLLAAPFGLLFVPLAPFAWRGLAAGHAALARRLLGPTRSSLSARVAALSVSRDRAVDVAAAERRRIERDLHDGAQQRLVALAMDLGMAREKFATDPDGAQELVEQAHEEAKRALVELRDLARGIHPAVLTDRGLDAAISALAGRSPVPVEVAVDLARRPPPAVESTVYFVVSEALTNVARHGAARHATVHVREQDGRLMAEVGDDGVGGARLTEGSGLRGLADRLAALDGTLDVSSPAGGPTIVRAELPCAW